MSANRRAQLVVIRVIDVAAALAAGVLLSPVVLLLALLVRATSPGPALFRQQRVGLREAPFTCLKLRTMAEGTPAAGTHEIAISAVTPLGRVLRRFKLDELPQLWNVLTGDMSLVGPRPCLPSQTELVERRRELGVFEVRPGVTGCAQVKGIDMSNPALLAREDQAWASSPTVVTYARLVIATLAGRGLGDRVGA